MKIFLPVLLTTIISTCALAIEFEGSEIRFDTSLEVELHRIQNNFKSRGTPTFASVGNGTECTHTTIQSAIDSNMDEVRVVHDHIYNENITIIADRDLMIRGDYNSCINANNGNPDIASGLTAIIEGISGTVVTIDAPGSITNRGGETPVIRISNIEITNGTGVFGGGILMLPDVAANIHIDFVDINNNTSILGGGISILGEGSIGIHASSINNNTANNGGGIYCSNSLAVIYNYSTDITANIALQGSGNVDGKGGGIYASNQCLLGLSSHPSGNGVSFNHAEGPGGGIYAESGAKIYFSSVTYCGTGVTGCHKTSMRIAFNESDSDHSGNENGGGAFITGANTLLEIQNGYFAANKTGGHGGAISIENGALLSTDITSNCWNNDYCLYFEANNAGEQSFGAGGAIFNSSSTAEINHAIFEDNRADFGTVLYGSGLNSLTTINGSIINNNGDGGGNTGANGFSDNYVLRVVSDAVLRVLSSTIADNNATLGVLGISTSSTTDSSIYSSIIHDASSGNVFSNSSGYNTDCILAHEIDSFLEDDGTSFVADPSFVEQANRDYHILPTSFAVDRCYAIFGGFPSGMLDIDLQPKGYDDPNQPNILGPFDIGADETYFSDIIFKHGFEES